MSDNIGSYERRVIGFERLRGEYESCPNFGEMYIMLRDRPTREMNGFLLHDRYLFKFHKLCISRSSLRNFLYWELHVRDLAGHLGQNKKIEAVEHRFYWPSSKRDVTKIVGQYCTCNWPNNKNRLPVLTLLSQYLVALGKIWIL